MKVNEKKELRTKTVADIRKLLKEAKDSLAQLRLEYAQAKLKNTRSLFNKRKEIAVLQTILNLKKKEEK